MRLFFTLLFLSACSSTPTYRWVKDGSTRMQFNMERAQCESKALAVSQSKPDRIALVFATCMEGKGWHLVEQ